jgi:hypothetical protein
MTGRRIALKGYRLDRQGRLVKDAGKLDVSARIRERNSKKVRTVRRGTQPEGTGK